MAWPAYFLIAWSMVVQIWAGRPTITLGWRSPPNMQAFHCGYNQQDIGFLFKILRLLLSWRANLRPGLINSRGRECKKWHLVTPGRPHPMTISMVDHMSTHDEVRVSVH